MARQINRLSARKVATLDAAGRHADGGGLYLSISKTDGALRRRWVFLYRWQGKLREMGLGSVSAVSLAQARQHAAKWRLLLAEGKNPLDAKQAERAAGANSRTFLQVAKGLHAQKSKAWKSEKVRAQWLPPLERYAKRILGKPVEQIKTDDIVACLEPIWSDKPEVASRVRGRIEATLDAARVLGLIPPHHANPARWRGHLSHILPKRRRLIRGHHPAMPYRDVPDFVERLRDRPAMAALALEFAILTAGRTSEVLGAARSEINKSERVWIIPAKRMKTPREHRVPLTDRALAIVDEAARAGGGPFIFAGQKPNKPLSGMALEMMMRRMNVSNATVHGFRSSFRDWAGECTAFPRELAEAALAHVVGDEVERAYRRGDALERRRELMLDWERFLHGGGVRAASFERRTP